MNSTLLACPDLEKFFSYVEKTDSCWFWKPCKGINKYGRFKSNGSVVLSHRFSFENVVGIIPDGHEVCHSCDRKNCVRPSHLYSATHKQNIADAYARKLVPLGRGRAKLTRPQVVEIFLSLESPLTLAVKFGVSRPTIHNIKARRFWQNVTASLLSTQSAAPASQHTP
jgi:hypothetical protein